jgi:L-malate glycosyltransferase
LVATRAPKIASSRLSRVLYAIELTPSLKYGSLEEQMFSLARAFHLEDGLFLPLFRAAPGPDALAMYERAGLAVEWLDLAILNLATLSRLVQIIRRNQIELVHWNLYRPVNPYLCFLTFVMPGLRHYLTDHITRELPPVLPAGGFRRRVKSLMVRRYSKVLCVSEFVRTRLEEEGIWPNLMTWTHFINTDRFRPDEVTRVHLREELGVTKQFAVLVVAQLVRWKGVDVLLKALSRLPSTVVAWVVGDGRDAAELRELCRTLRLEQRVRFFGYQVDVSRYMQAADCLVCPTVWGEAAGLVILEALACGLPVIASAVGGIPEVIEDSRTGFLFAPGDDGELADRIKRLASDPGSYREMGLAARSVVVKRFSTESRLSAYLDVYRLPPPGGHHE